MSSVRDRGARQIGVGDRHLDPAVTLYRHSMRDDLARALVVLNLDLNTRHVNAMLAHCAPLVVGLNVVVLTS